MITSWFIAENQANNARKVLSTQASQQNSNTDENKIPSSSSTGEDECMAAPPSQPQPCNPQHSITNPISNSVATTRGGISSSAVQHHTNILPSLLLTPLQSCTLHGWLNPRRTLHWDDVAKSKDMTLKKLMGSGLTASDLKTMQPDVLLWIKHKGVGLADVPSMVEWPLHPVQHLRANIGDLATMHFSPALMQRLGITYTFLRTYMRMNDDWMKLLHYTPAEWAAMGFGRDQAVAMGRKRIEWVFEPMEFNALVMVVSSAAPHQCPDEYTVVTKQ